MGLNLNSTLLYPSPNGTSTAVISRLLSELAEKIEYRLIAALLNVMKPLARAINNKEHKKEHNIDFPRILRDNCFVMKSDHNLVRDYITAADHVILYITFFLLKLFLYEEKINCY
jgi:hypothetical protein